MITLEPDQWEGILDKIKIEYADTPSVFLIRGTMRRVLGFTVREHKAWVPKMSGGYTKLEICLDFYSEYQETFFRLKYL